jgi:hypothetical protein
MTDAPAVEELEVERGSSPQFGSQLRRAAVVVIAMAVVGVPAGVVWAVIAPHALLSVAGKGVADVVNVESEAYVAADGWLFLILAVVGLAAGLSAYLAGGRRFGPGTAAGLALGGLVCAWVAATVGHQIGYPSYHHALALGKLGAPAHQPVRLHATPVYLTAAFFSLAAFSICYWLFAARPAARAARGG